MKKKLLFLFLLAFPVICLSQISDNILKQAQNVVNSQKTANSKDILTTLFQAGIDNLLGEDRSFKFNSSFYGIDSIFRGKNATPLDFISERKLRQKSLNISLTGDSTNSIIKFSGGLSLTLINKRDLAVNKLDSTEKNKLQRYTLLMADIRKEIIAVITAKHNTAFENTEVQNTILKSWQTALDKGDFSKLHPFIKEALNESGLVESVEEKHKLYTSEEITEVINSLINHESPFKKQFEEIAEKYSRKPLWTFTPTLTYDRVNEQGEYSFASEFTAGLGKNLLRKPWELEIKAQFKIANDTSLKKANHDNKPLMFSIGLNKVLIETDEKEPKMEFKFFTQYDYQFGNVPSGKEAGVFTLNSTMRVNIFKSLWLPVTLKYDPESGNFLGFFSITANLGD